MQKDWWDGKVIGFLTRNDVPLIGLAIIEAFLYFGINWDVVFGLRLPH